MDCCTVGSPGEAAVPLRCPGCGNAGRAVARITVKAILTPQALARLSDPEHRFCPTTFCPIVYFGRAETFDRDEVSVPVFQKEPAGDRTVCYCFAVTETDLRQEITATGRSRVAAEITAHVKAERCACEVKNPQGNCCLGNLASTVRDAMAAVATAEGP
jgi:hypothetical protein